MRVVLQGLLAARTTVYSICIVGSCNLMPRLFCLPGNGANGCSHRWLCGVRYNWGDVSLQSAREGLHFISRIRYYEVKGMLFNRTAFIADMVMEWCDPQNENT